MTDGREHVDALTDLESKQNVRLTLGDGTTVAARISQFDYTPEERLRLELSVAGENARYQARAVCEDGEWAPVEVRRYAIGTEGADWETLGEVAEVTPRDAPQGSEP
jgi:hypothetical protein